MYKGMSREQLLLEVSRLEGRLKAFQGEMQLRLRKADMGVKEAQAEVETLKDRLNDAIMDKMRAEQDLENALIRLRLMADIIERGGGGIES